MNDNFNKVTDEFITQRVTHYGKNETEAVNSAYLELRACVDRLRESLTEEQIKLLRACENAYHTADGETARFYYIGGFKDAIRFLMDWGEHQ